MSACLTGGVRGVPRFDAVSTVLARRIAAMVATWLILPVVIRLSQRLSHACLSISESETANGSLYQL